MSLNNKVAIKQLTREFANDLRKHSYFEGSDALNTGFFYKILQAAKLSPNSTNLVAYHTEDKVPIGFLCLKENSEQISSIERVFVHPEYRKLGVATVLFNYAFSLAEDKGIRKLSLSVYPTKTDAIRLYETLGFKKIGNTVLGQGYLRGPAPTRIAKRIIAGQTYLAKYVLEKGKRQMKIGTNAQNQKTLFGIFKNCVHEEWIDFFELNPNNFLRTSRYLWQPQFLTEVLNYDLPNSFALMSNIPFSWKNTIELYSTSNSATASFLDNLINILENRGIAFTQITIFNPDNKALNWFKMKGMRIFDFIVMAKTM